MVSSLEGSDLAQADADGRVVRLKVRRAEHVRGSLVEAILGKRDLAPHEHGVGVVRGAHNDLLAKVAGKIHSVVRERRPRLLHQTVNLER